MEEKKDQTNRINAIPTAYRYAIITKDGEIETQSLEIAYIIDKLNEILDKLEK